MAIEGASLVSGVGLSLDASCAAIRCGINNFQDTRFMDSNGEWIVGSEVPLEKPWRGATKLAQMLRHVIEETFSRHPELDRTETPFLICIAERDRPGRVNALKQRLAAELSQQLTLDDDSEFISQGRVGAAVALRKARSLLYEDRRDAVVIAGVDSLLMNRTLTVFEEKHRLVTSTNSNGFLPGEGASAIVVKRPKASTKPQLLAVGLGYGLEKATVESEAPLRADGLVEALKEALQDARCDMGALDYRITDVSGEQYAFKEATLALQRTLRVRKEEFDIWHAADCVGETGAAIGAITLNVAWAAAEKAYAKGNNLVCHFGNDDGKRAAVVLTYQPVGASGG